MIIDFCISGTPKDDITHIPNDSRDAEESVSAIYLEKKKYNILFENLGGK